MRAKVVPKAQQLMDTGEIDFLDMFLWEDAEPFIAYMSSWAGFVLKERVSEERVLEDSILQESNSAG